jgi:hypothetical protein
MIAYNKTLFGNTLLVDEAVDLKEAGFINTAQLQFIEKQLPALNSHSNFFARAGLFLLGLLLQLAVLGVLMLIAFSGGSSNEESVFSTIALLFSIATFLTLELFCVRTLNYYGNGIDDALLVGAQSGLLSFLGIAMGYDDASLAYYLAATLVFAACAMRYADRFSILMTCLSLSKFVISLCIQLGTAGQALLPFIVMLLSTAIYIFYKWARKTTFAKLYYEKCLVVCYAFSLFLFYMAGNYFVVREASESILYRQIQPGEDIPLALFFYAFTALCLLAYIYLALKQKNRILLWMGLIFIGFSVFSIRYYYHVMPPEAALLIGGAFLSGVGYFGIKKLKNKTSGLSYEEDRFASTDDSLNLENLAIIESYAVKPGSNDSSDNIEFGEGKFGGGGSGEKY